MNDWQPIELLRAAWCRQIANEGVDRILAERIVALAEMNGLFDAAKETFAREQALRSDTPSP